MSISLSPIMRPVTATERIHILDILRGFAIFGILAVNIGGFASLYFMPGYTVSIIRPWYDIVAENLMIFLTEGKFYTIFSFLFGLGFSIQMTRAEAKGKDIRSLYARRLWVLLGLGILHAILFWTGDILRVYALLGFALLGFRKCSNRTLLIWIGIFFVLSLFMVTPLISGFDNSNITIPNLDILGMAREAYTGSAVWPVLIFQSIALPFSFLFIFLVQGPSVMALFLLGLLVGRSKLFEKLAENRAFFKHALWIGLLLGVFGESLFLTENSFLASLGFTFGVPGLAAFYISGLSLLSLSAGGAKLLAPIANVGRMALSNYVMQSVVCSLIFNGYGLGLYEKVGAAGLWGIVFAIYLCQIPLSGWWLSRFQFGPLEWVWRSLTYGQKQPFRVKPCNTQKEAYH